MKNDILNLGVYVVLALVLSTGLSACGVKSQPRSPENSTFPRQYPTPLPPSKTVPAKPAAPESPVSDPDSFYQYPNTPPKK